MDFHFGGHFGKKRGHLGGIFGKKGAFWGAFLKSIKND